MRQVHREDDISLEQLRDMIEDYYNKKFGGTKIFRKLNRIDLQFCTFFFLEGSPYKGFALYIPELQTLALYNCRGKQYKNYYVANNLKFL
jgi:hypothetical protein